ncbi:MAG: adenosine kinase [Bacteroides sp.]
MEKIIGLGNALVDVLARVDNDEILETMELPKGSMTLINDDKFLKINEYLLQQNTKLSNGGSAGNAIRALAHLESATGFIGKVGNDLYGNFFRKELKKLGIEDKMLVSAERPSGVASTFISDGGERTFATFLGAAATLQPEELTQEMFKDYTYLFIEGYLVQDHDLILQAIEQAKAAGLQVCLDMASYNIVEENLDFFKMLLSKYVDVVFANEHEARAFTGLEPEEALEVLGKLCSIAVVKVGARGTYIRKGTEMMHVPASDVKHPTDTTGAGDFFAAGFLHGLTCGLSLDKCGRMGSLLAGHVIQIVGTTLTPNRWEKIRRGINEIKEG